MKIQLGNILMNRTKRYLLPVLKSFGKDFEQKYTSQVFKIALGIGDIVTIKSKITLNKHLFILIDTKASTDFPSFLNWIRNESIYETDYAFDDLRTGHQHMIVVLFPQEYYQAFETFKKSEYSKMYSKEELQEFFSSESDTAKILVKDNSYKMTFADKIYEEFKVKVVPEEISDNYEFDFPIDENEEVFNKHLQG